MSSVKPIELSDLSGAPLDPQDLTTDQLIGYCGYMRNLNQDLGTPNDTEEGYADYISFQKEIEAARISTFEPDAIDDDHTFDEMDLTGENVDIPIIPMTYYAMINGAIWWSYNLNNGKGATPFDIKEGEAYVRNDNVGVTPFDLIGNNPVQGIPAPQEDLVLTN